LKTTKNDSSPLSQLLYQCKVAAELLEKYLESHETNEPKSSQPSYPEASQEEDSILVYLLPLLCLLFRTRDQAAFDFAQKHPAFINAQLASKIKHLPTFFQLTALLGSIHKPISNDSPSFQSIEGIALSESNELLSSLMTLSDETLGLTSAKSFKESFLVKGTPPETPSQQVALSLLKGWNLLEIALEKMPQIH
jgi:hypothetical protein